MPRGSPIRANDKGGLSDSKGHFGNLVCSTAQWREWSVKLQNPTAKTEGPSVPVTDRQ